MKSRLQSKDGTVKQLFGFKRTLKKAHQQLVILQGCTASRFVFTQGEGAGRENSQASPAKSSTCDFGDTFWGARPSTPGYWKYTLRSKTPNKRYKTNKPASWVKLAIKEASDQRKSMYPKVRLKLAADFVVRSKKVKLLSSHS